MWVGVIQNSKLRIQNSQRCAAETATPQWPPSHPGWAGDLRSLFFVIRSNVGGRGRSSLVVPCSASPDRRGLLPTADSLLPTASAAIQYRHDHSLETPPRRRPPRRPQHGPGCGVCWRRCRRSGSAPALRLYGWSPPCLTLGRHQGVEAADLDFCREHGIDVVRRPTGGRACSTTWNSPTPWSLLRERPDPAPPAGGLPVDLRASGGGLPVARCGCRADVGRGQPPTPQPGIHGALLPGAGRRRGGGGRPQAHRICHAVPPGCHSPARRDPARLGLEAPGRHHGAWRTIVS